ncbi:ectoine hydroxylase-related dioxygenase (phytanoyl-CoA dioxygenase family) [Paraburkholderia sp. GAS41]|jgi:phytanoyl-CoA hydroxylase|uniref:hypothetical protein n=1 Tax=Paraburkholderia sp. GAS41 TaxID=3035134 RepID=UPI003D1E188E
MRIDRSYRHPVVEQCDDAGLSKKMLSVQAGDTVIWHPQLPHGGGKIADMSKSRFSLVMHTTPIGVPVYHQDKFFRPDNTADMDAHWAYEQVDGAYRVAHNEVNFAHQESFAVSDFKQPQIRTSETKGFSPSALMDRILRPAKKA